MNSTAERLKELRELGEQDGEEFAEIINSVYGSGNNVSALSTLLYGLNDNIEDLGNLWIKQDLESYIEGLMKFKRSFTSIFINEAHILSPHANETLSAILLHILETPEMFNVLVHGIQSGELKITEPVRASLTNIAEKGSKQATEILLQSSSFG